MQTTIQANALPRASLLCHCLIENKVETVDRLVSALSEGSSTRVEVLLIDITTARLEAHVPIRGCNIISPVQIVQISHSRSLIGVYLCAWRYSVLRT